MQPTIDAILKAKTCLVCSHVAPDGDTLASMLALGIGLEQLGKQVTYFNADGVPQSLLFLPGSNKVNDHIPNNEFDVAISLDCGSKERLGKKFLKCNSYKQLINIDHHASNNRYGDINYVIPDAASTGEVVWEVLKKLKCKLNTDIAVNIYCTLVTDTGSFRYSNTDAHTFRLAADMVDAGVKPESVSQNLFESHPMVMFDLLSRLLSRIKCSMDGRYSWSVLFQKDLLETGSTYDVTEEFINYPRAIRGVEVAALFKERSDQKYKISLRSKTDVDVSKICGKFKGGGHKKAAACVIDGTFEEVKAKIDAEVQSVLK